MCESRTTNVFKSDSTDPSRSFASRALDADATMLPRSAGAASGTGMDDDHGGGGGGVRDDHDHGCNRRSTPTADLSSAILAPNLSSAHAPSAQTSTVSVVCSSCQKRGCIDGPDHDDHFVNVSSMDDQQLRATAASYGYVCVAPPFPFLIIVSVQRSFCTLMIFL
jgi:hypothetical protein